MPFANAERGIAVRQQHLGQEAVLERDRAIRPWKAGRALGNAGHAVRVVIATRQHAGARRRAQGGGVHVGIEQTALSQPIEVRGVDRRSVATELPVAGVVEHDVQDVRRTRFGAERSGPCRLRFTDGSAHSAGEGGAWLVLGQGHFSRSHRWTADSSPTFDAKINVPSRRHAVAPFGSTSAVLQPEFEHPLPEEVF